MPTIIKIMNSKNLMNLDRIIVADKTADLVHRALKINKTRAVDTYDIAKKIGLNSRKTSIEHINFDEIRNNNNKKANDDRFLLAKTIAKYIIISALPNADMESNDTKDTIDALALSLVIPKNEATKMYRNLKSTKLNDNDIAYNLALLYGVNKEIATLRLDQIKLGENLKNVPQK